MSANEMMLGLLGKKLGMSRIFQEDGTVVPVTVIQAGPCNILNIRTKERDGYLAIQLGFGKRKKKRVNKPQLKYYEKMNLSPAAFVKEIPVATENLLKEVNLGQEVKVDIFEGVKKVDVVGITKGRGFAGCIKRHHFHRGPETHGCKCIREPGSVGRNSNPGRIIKGKKMAGRYGADQRTAKNLKVIRIDKENNVIFVNGSVPGPVGGYVIVQKNADERNKWGLSACKAKYTAK